jgi:hypothetical protein
MALLLKNQAFKNKKPLQISIHSQLQHNLKNLAVIKNVETRGLTSRGATLLHCNILIFSRKNYCSALFGYLHILSYDYGGFRPGLLSCSIIPDIFPDFYQTSHGPIQTPALQPHSHHRRLSLCCLMLTIPGQRLCTDFKEQLLLFNLLKN